MVKMSTNLGKIGQSKILGIVMLVQEELEMVA
jgi:hypothetical protein